MCVCWDIGIRSEGISKERAKGESRTEEREGERETEINKLFFSRGFILNPFVFFLSLLSPAHLLWWCCAPLILTRKLNTIRTNETLCVGESFYVCIKSPIYPPVVEIILSLTKRWTDQ